MMESSGGLRAIVALAIVLCIVASLTGARGEDKNAGGLRVAIIDIIRTQDEYKVIKNFRGEATKKQDAFKIQVATCQQNPLLSEADQKALTDLNVKEKTGGAPLSTAEKKAQTDLLEKSRKINDEYSRLQSTAAGQLSEKDKAQLEGLIRSGSETENRLKVTEQSLTSEMQTRVADTAAQTQKNMKEALKQVAKEKGFNLVLSAEFAPYADYDCTDDVIKVLNK
jgi:Skp family chaperone for outer membrane proteins